MSQEDYDIENQSFPNFRTDLNNNLGAIATNNSGATEPATTFPYMLWADTTAGKMKQRNAGNTAWIELWDLTAGIIETDLSSPDPIGDVTPNTIEGTTITANGSFIQSQGVAVVSATQPNIWSGDGNTLHITGTSQIDDFTDAPRIGAKVTLIFDDVLTLKNGLGITLQGGADIITAAGDRFEVYADTINAFSGLYYRADGSSIVAPAFRGALVAKTANQTTSNNVAAQLSWNDEDYDTDNIHDNSTNNSRLTVPSGVSYVRLTASSFWSFNTSSYRQLELFKNGGSTFEGRSQDSLQAGNNANMVTNFSSAVLAVTGGDYFEVFATQGSGGNLDVQGGFNTWFSMEIIG